MKYAFWSVLILLVLTFFVPHASARPFFFKDTQYYKIKGKTEKQLNDSMARRGPRFDDGERRPARTLWHVETHYDHKKTNKGCHLTRVRVRVNVTHFAPRIASDSLFTVWIDQAAKRFNRALKKYQQGHEKIARKAGREVENMLKKLSAGDNCDEYEEKADNKTQKIVERYVEKAKAYDEKTNYGETLGVKF